MENGLRHPLRTNGVARPVCAQQPAAPSRRAANRFKDGRDRRRDFCLPAYLKLEGVGEGVGGGVSRAQGFEIEALLDQRQNRRRLVLRVVYVALLCELRDHDDGYARSRPPAVDDGRCHVIPSSAVFVVRDDDDGVVAISLTKLNEAGAIVFVLDESTFVAGSIVSTNKA